MDVTRTCQPRYKYNRLYSYTFIIVLYFKEKKMLLARERADDMQGLGRWNNLFLKIQIAVFYWKTQIGPPIIPICHSCGVTQPRGRAKRQERVQVLQAGAPRKNMIPLLMIPHTTYCYF